MKMQQTGFDSETTIAPNLAAVEFICSGCGKTLPLVAPEQAPQCASEAALKLGWTFETDEVTHGIEAFCADCSTDRQRLSNEGGGVQAETTDSAVQSPESSQPCPD